MSEGGQGAAPETALLTGTGADLMTETDTDAGESWLLMLQQHATVLLLQGAL